MPEINNKMTAKRRVYNPLSAEGSTNISTYASYIKAEVTAGTKQEQISKTTYFHAKIPSPFISLFRVSLNGIVYRHPKTTKDANRANRVPEKNNCCANGNKKQKVPFINKERFEYNFSILLV